MSSNGLLAQIKPTSFISQGLEKKIIIIIIIIIIITSAPF